MGPPGSGKGSISSLCTQELAWVQLSTGNLCRRHIAEQTEIGREIAFAIKSGKLVSDHLITSMVDVWLTEQLDNGSVVILDGYPRAVAQAKALKSLLKDKFPSLQLHVVNFVVPDEIIISRLTNRVICSNSECQAVYTATPGSPQQSKKAMVCDMCASPLVQRSDDTLVAAKERLDIYHKHTQDLLQFYRDIKQPVIELKADVPLSHVFNDFKKLMDLQPV